MGRALCEDLTGRKFDRLMVVQKDTSSNKPGNYYICKCDCGETKSIRAANLKCGATRSCGCNRGRTVVRKTGTVWNGKQYIRREKYRGGSRYILQCTFCGKLSWTSGSLKRVPRCICQAKTHSIVSSLTLADTEKIKELLSQGYSISAVSRTIGISRYAIKRYVTENNLSYEVSHRPLTLGRVEDIKNLLREGFNLSDIARKYRIHVSAVSRFLKRQGIVHRRTENRAKNWVTRNPRGYIRTAKRIIGPEKIAEIQSLLDGGMSVTKAGRKLSINPELIYREIRHFKTITYTGHKNGLLPDNKEAGCAQNLQPVD